MASASACEGRFTNESAPAKEGTFRGWGALVLECTVLGYPLSLDVWNILWRGLDRAWICVPARYSAYPGLCGNYFSCWATDAITLEDFFAESVDPSSGDSSAPLAFDAKGRICVDVALVHSPGPAIAVVLILAVRNLGAGHAPAKRCGNDDQGGRGTNSFGQAHYGSLPLFIDDAVRYRPALKGRIG